MDIATARAGKTTAIVLIATIITQLLYMASLGGPTAADPGVGVTQADSMRYFDERWTEIASVWLAELLAFVALFAAALIALTRRAIAPAAWAALALAAVANIVQIGMGLAMFRPAAAAGQEFEAMSTMVVEGAFFFYFLAKFLIGLAGAVFGLTLVQQARGSDRVIGIMAIIVGLGAAVINFLALPQGLGMVIPAGASGTLAALTTALAASAVARLPNTDPLLK